MNIWSGIMRLGKFIDVSPAHAEMIVCLQRIAKQESRRKADVKSLRALASLFSALMERVQISDSFLDEMYDQLEGSNVHIDGPCFPVN
jgi:hypothetical protein